VQATIQSRSGSQALQLSIPRPSLSTS
jgi:hypothetical protein